jgi:hypothetical protein
MSIDNVNNVDNVILDIPQTKSVINNSSVIINKFHPSGIRQKEIEKILIQIIEPAYYLDIDSIIKSRRRWRICGHVFETISKIMIALSGILSFSSGYYTIPVLGFLAGSSSTLSLACVQFSSYCFKESKDNTEELNKLLTKINLDTLPDYDNNIQNDNDKKN